MSITFDSNKTFVYISREVGGNFDTTNHANEKDFNLFDNNASVNDAIYFGMTYRSWNFHDLTFNIGTALEADNIVLKWEYNKLGTWTEIPNLTDNTNSFQTLGVNSILFDVPEYMCGAVYWFSTVNSTQALWIRCRIDSVTNITNGGANTTDTVKVKNFTITCTNETSLTLSDIQNACDVGGWEARNGVPAVETKGLYTIIRPHLMFTGTTAFSAKGKMIQMGETNYPQGFHSSASGTTTIGELDSSGKGKNGCSLYMEARYGTPYDAVKNFQGFASTVTRPTGYFGAFSMDGVFKFVDSVFNSNTRLYIPATVADGSEWTRSVYACTDLLYVYSPYLKIDTFKSLDNWQGLLSGGSSVISNTDIGGADIKRFYGASIQLINCTNIDRSKITSTVPSGSADLHVREKYRLALKTVATDSSTVQDINISMFDINNTNIFSLVSDANGDIPDQVITVFDKWWEYANSWALHEDDFNPFRLSYRAYGYKSSDVITTLLSQTKSSKVVETNPFATKSETDAGNITDIVIDGVAKTVTINAERTVNDIYDYVQYWHTRSSNLIYDEPISTIDGINYSLADGWTIILESKVTGQFNISGTVKLTTALDLDNININGSLHVLLGVNGTLNFSNISAIVYNDDASHTLTINASGGSNLTASVSGTANGETNIVQSVTLTVSGLKANSEVRLYDSDLNEIGGVENSGTTEQFVYSQIYNNAILVIHHIEYQPIRIQLNLIMVDSTLPIQQVVDRNYSNPI